jgi:outer membrane protein OmpA-like peptidoglycan-associated protein
MRKLLVAVPIVMLAVGSTACATKKFVRTSVGEVNDKVEATNRSLEETQERTRRNEARIGEVDTKAGTAQTSADKAGAAANAADAKAGSAADAARAADAKADAIDKASKKIVYEVVLSEDQGKFKFGKAVLPDEAKAALDAMVSQLKADPKGAYFEIEGHTDNTGAKLANEKLGMDRAEAVKRYLYETHQIPLHRMNVISYGEDKPAAPNNTKAGREQNRRVVIRVLA